MKGNAEEKIFFTQTHAKPTLLGPSWMEYIQIVDQAASLIHSCTWRVSGQQLFSETLCIFSEITNGNMKAG